MLWHKVVSSIHRHSNFNLLSLRSGVGGIWKAIVGIKDTLAYYDYDLLNALNGEFDTKHIKWTIDKKHATVEEEAVFKWNNWVPKKVNIMNWRASCDRLPTLKALDKRGITVQTNTCILCQEALETTEHIFTSCPAVINVWNGIASWCEIVPIYAFSMKDILELHIHKPGSQTWKKLINAIALVTCWYFWQARNDKIHNRNIKTTYQILNEVKTMAFLWIGNRASKICADWNEWNSFSISL